VSRLWKSTSHGRVRTADQSRRSHRIKGRRGEIVACDPKEARNSEQAIHIASSLAKTEGHCGAIAFSRSGDPALGDFDDAVILETIGEVDAGYCRPCAALMAAKLLADHDEPQLASSCWRGCVAFGVKSKRSSARSIRKRAASR
jgi:hypothetical protein